MKKKKNTEHENNRLMALYSHKILDTEIEEAYDQITSFATYLCKTPIALINFVDDQRLWVKSGLGLEEKELPRNHSFCSYAIEGKGIFEIQDAREDSRFKDTPHVINRNIVFYAGVPLIDSDGNALGTICVIDTKPRKLTSRQKKSLEMLALQVSTLLKTQRAKVRYETLIESSRDMIYKLDRDGKFVFVNKSTIKQTGYSFDELKEMTCWDLVIEEEREKVKQHYISQLKQKKTSSYYEFPIKNKFGKEIWLGQSVDYTFVGDHGVKAYVIARDISELIDTRIRLKETEEQILAEKTLLKTMVFSAPAAIAMFNKDMRCLAFSEQWMNKKAVNEKVIGLGESQEEGLSLFKEVLNGKTIEKENDRVLDEEGNEYWLKWVATPWNNTTDGSVGGVIVYTDDITQMVCHETELRQAKEEALASGKAKEEFLSSMSHEIRTPLNAIIGTTNLLLDQKPELGEDENFKLLKFSSNNLLSLINNILDFSKIESGNIVMENKDFNLKELASNLINSWKPVAIQKRIDLMLKWDDTVPAVVKGDKLRLSQVLNNLMNNALKFTDEGYVQLKICEAAGHEGIHFEIRDSGMGIPSDQQDLIFESFRQAEGNIKEGTGLGLPICKKLLGMMGADLLLESKVGFGTIFNFDLDLEVGQLDDQEDSNYSRQQLDKDMKLLVVEDNKTNQFIIESFLRMWGVDFEMAENGREAIEKLTPDSFDILFMDMRMPVMDGYTAARIIREKEDPYFKKVPIIALTASSILDISKQASALYFDDYLSKPFNPSDLYNLLCKFSKNPGTCIQVMAKEKNEKNENKGADKAEVLRNLLEYTEIDQDFLVEFSNSMIGNLIMLKDELGLLSNQKETELRELIHKVSPTIEIIGAMDLLDKLSRLRSCKVTKAWLEAKKEIDILTKRYQEILESIIEENRTVKLKTA